MTGGIIRSARRRPILNGEKIRRRCPNARPIEPRETQLDADEGQWLVDISSRPPDKIKPQPWGLGWGNIHCS